MHFNVLTGLSRPKDGVASLAYVPAIHVFLAERRKSWMPGDKAGHDKKEAMRFRPSLPGLTRQSMMSCSRRNQYCLRTWNRIMDARVKPAHDK